MDRSLGLTFVWANLGMAQNDTTHFDPQRQALKMGGCSKTVKGSVSSESPCRGPVELRFPAKCAASRSKGLGLCALIAALAATSISGCGTAHATLDFVAPSTATVGTPFTVTVHVLYRGKPDTVINGHIDFKSSDPAAVLPPTYYFTAADAGSHTWANGFTLSTPGQQTISGSIFDATGINGSATITVSH